ncbi:Uncharacterised protein [Mycobacteroides abscessus subsp. abscessus]|uniref:hypothetical protein n=1 Tax=Mycobacteroides abscessus TaxID=36809 RepID=UPI0005E7F9EE|nr:hypothetical protein [Mycobacteroides abscessus]MBE5505798.1 hypothetical protein [Mycobacteroides abscessus]MBN7329824.1 hypothetical protein [Mycobacteroides abscessus subsp. abscessus]MBN7564497.1 hypothetical protein [Mycobacteroides abscessus subsp. massiliense]MDO2989387.1 hypothetical protein [Mycobacteroides abscessus subsp. massiliense]MDO3053343.1 hypothetical protein [Mycobacteroides abscessus subsp. massiliense]
MERKVSVSIVAMRFRKARQTVLKAITEGRLPAESVPIAGGRRVYLIDPADAEALWSTDIRVSA